MNYTHYQSKVYFLQIVYIMNFKLALFKLHFYINHYECADTTILVRADHLPNELNDFLKTFLPLSVPEASGALLQPFPPPLS